MHSENKELVRVGHDFAKAISADTPISEIAKMVTRLADKLDVTNAAVARALKERDALVAEASEMRETLDAVAGCWFKHVGGEMYEWQVADQSPADAIAQALDTPATDAAVAEMQAQGVDMAIEHLIKKFEITGRIGVPIMALEWLATQLRMEAGNEQ